MNKILLVLCIAIFVFSFVGSAASQSPPGQDVPGSLPWQFVPGSEHLAIDVFAASFSTGLISDYHIEWIDNPDYTQSLVLWMRYDHTRYDFLFVRDAILCQLEVMFAGWRNSCPVG